MNFKNLMNEHCFENIVSQRLKLLAILSKLRPDLNLKFSLLLFKPSTVCNLPPRYPSDSCSGTPTITSSTRWVPPVTLSFLDSTPVVSPLVAHTHLYSPCQPPAGPTILLILSKSIVATLLNPTKTLINFL